MYMLRSAIAERGDSFRGDSVRGNYVLDSVGYGLGWVIWSISSPDSGLGWVGSVCLWVGLGRGL